MPVTQPWGPVEIEVKMAQVIEAQDDAVAEMKALGEAFATKRRDYEKLKNRTLLSLVGDPNYKTDALRLAKATLEAADARYEKDLAEGAWNTQREVVKVLISQADTLRSLARSSRDVLDDAGFGGRR